MPQQLSFQRDSSELTVSLIEGPRICWWSLFSPSIPSGYFVSALNINVLCLALHYLFQQLASPWCLKNNISLHLIKKIIFSEVPLQVQSVFPLLFFPGPGRPISETAGSYIRGKRFRGWCFRWIHRLDKHQSESSIPSAENTLLL